MTVLLLTRLRDVEHQLWQASTAVKLHLKLLGASSGDRNDVAVAVEQVQTLVTSIEQVQHELQSSTTEILSLARKMTIRDGNDIEEVADGEETETEDEDEEEENFQPKQEPEEPSEVPEQVEQSAEEGETLTLGGAFEFLKTLQVEPEAVDLSRDIDEEQETVAQQVEQELGVMTVEDGRSDTKHVDDEEIRDIHEAQATGDEEREVVTVEKTSDIHSLNYVNAESIQQNHDGGENVFMETEPVVIKNNEDEEEEGEVLAVEEKAVTSETNTISSTELRAQIAAIRRSAMSMTIDYERRLQAGNCSVEDATAFSRDITTMTSVVTRYRSKYCRRLWIEQIVGMLTWILEGVKKPELLQALEPARDSCVQLQQYCKAQYPNYLQDLLYDVTTVKALEQENALDSSNLGSFLQLFVDQLRFDCLEHSSKVTMTGIDLRSEEQWGNVNTICEQLIALINQADGQHITVESARETILVLREFDKRFPTRIPAELLGRLNAIAPNTLGKRRSRSDPSADGPTQKRVAHHDFHGEVTRVVNQYVNVAKLVMIDGAASIRDESTAKVIARLKTAATAANDAVYKFVESCDHSDTEIGAHFSSATAFTAKIICGVPVREVEYAWLRQMIDGLFAILDMHSTILVQEQEDSLVSSTEILESHCHLNYVPEDRKAPSLKLLEERVRRFQKDPSRLTNPITIIGPIQSLSSGFVQYFKTWAVNKCMVRTEENWKRFKAAGEVLAEWIQCSSQGPTLHQSKLMRNFLDELENFADKYSGRLPSSLLTITTALAPPKVRLNTQEQFNKLPTNVKGVNQGAQKKQAKRVKPKFKVKGVQICYVDGQLAIVPSDPE